MKIAAGWDHRGRILREKLERTVRLLGHEFVAMGATTDESSDYPDFAFRVAEAVSRGEVDRGWLTGVTNVGVTAGASAPEHLVEELIAFLRNDGFRQVEEIEMVDEDVRFSLPSELMVSLR